MRPSHSMVLSLFSPNHSPVNITSVVMDNTTAASALGSTTISLKLQLDPNEALSCSRQYPECEAARILWIILCPSLLVVGTIGNFFVFAIMMSRALRKTAFGLYLAAISVTDTVAIWTGLVRHFTKNLFLYDIRSYSSFSCQFQKFFLFGSLNTSVWLLAAVTIERTLSIYAPTRSSVFKSVNRTIGVIVAIAVIQYGWNTHIFFTTGDKIVLADDGTTSIRTCGAMNRGSEIYLNSYHTYVAMINYSILPFALMLALNVAIIIKLRQRDRQYKDCATVSNTNGTVKHKKESSTRVTQSRVSQKTLMLLPVTVFFLVTTLPALVFTSIEQAVNTEDEVRANMELADFFFGSLLYFNHSMNFFLYCLSGKMFRKKCQSYLKQNCFCYLYQKSDKKTRYWEETNHRVNRVAHFTQRKSYSRKNAHQRITSPSLRALRTPNDNGEIVDSNCTVQTSVCV